MDPLKEAYNSHPNFPKVSLGGFVPRLAVVFVAIS